MKLLKKEDMKLVKGGVPGGAREQFCHNMMQLCWTRIYSTVGECVGGYMNCMYPS